jgi:hypothetical protein
MSELSRSERLELRRNEHKDAIIENKDSDARFTSSKGKRSQLASSVINSVTINDSVLERKYAISMTATVVGIGGSLVEDDPKLPEIQARFSAFLKAIEEEFKG